MTYDGIFVNKNPNGILNLTNTYCKSYDGQYCDGQKCDNSTGIGCDLTS